MDLSKICGVVIGAGNWENKAMIRCEVCADIDPSFYKGYFVCPECQDNIDMSEWNQQRMGATREYQHVWNQMKKAYKKLPTHKKVARAIVFGPVQDHFGEKI